ncbi:Luciferin 4-monooxygenase [Gryllus bimaculatus]|nr:Luciferin 4-monooxygenase [Gryllus bimaculatus]
MAHGGKSHVSPACHRVPPTRPSALQIRPHHKRASTRSRPESRRSYVPAAGDGRSVSGTNSSWQGRLQDPMATLSVAVASKLRHHSATSMAPSALKQAYLVGAAVGADSLYARALVSRVAAASYAPLLLERTAFPCACPVARVDTTPARCAPDANGPRAVGVVRFRVQCVAPRAMLAALGALARAPLALALSLAPLALLALVALAPFRRRLYVILVTLPRDLKLIYRFAEIYIISHLLNGKNVSVVTKFREQVAKHPNKACYIFEDTVWSFADVEKYSNKVARVFRKQGLGEGDAVSLVMENRPEFVCLWLGLAKLRVVTALVNTNLRQGPLAHSLRVAKSRAIIASAALAPAVREVERQLPLFVLGAGGDAVGEGGAVALEPLLAEEEPLPPEGVPSTGFRDPLLYIYTSGTTGLPKAAVMLNSRYLLMCAAANVMSRFRPDDVLYCPLPLYHSAGGVLGVGAALYGGLTVVMRAKFSASAYFPDCVRHGCTVGQYIGEICRYLLAVPPRPDDTAHRVRLLLGNGMRPQIWAAFVQRFKVPQIRELYGATEGNTNIGEPGMVIGIIDQKNVIREFHGYVDKKESEKKIICDVFKKGDKAFLSGDILVMDEYGYLFFKDRRGDTFRWKGENVSTAEVEAVISNVIDLKDATVYGVEVPGAEGRAGMVAVQDPEGSLDLQRLAAGVERSLPGYARPLFVRVTPRLQLTGTFKLKKTELQSEGFDPARVGPGDSLYVLQGGAYRPLTPDLHRQILDGSLRL